MIVSDAYANAVLDALAGPGKAAGLPNTMWVALYDGDPRDGGLELTLGTGGYARLGSISMTSGTMWPAATGRSKGNAQTIYGVESTGAWSGTATHGVLVDTASGTPSILGPASQLPRALVVSAAGNRPALYPGDLTLTLFDIDLDLGSF